MKKTAFLDEIIFVSIPSFILVFFVLFASAKLQIHYTEMFSGKDFFKPILAISIVLPLLLAFADLTMSFSVYFTYGSALSARKVFTDMLLLFVTFSVLLGRSAYFFHVISIHDFYVLIFSFQRILYAAAVIFFSLVAGLFFLHFFGGKKIEVRSFFPSVLLFSLEYYFRYVPAILLFMLGVYCLGEYWQGHHSQLYYNIFFKR